MKIWAFMDAGTMPKNLGNYNKYKVEEEGNVTCSNNYVG